MDIAAIIISAVSLILSVVSFVLSIKSQKLQDQVNEIELKLKNYELAEKEREQHKEPCVEARINHITKNDYKVRVWNSGNAVAKNVVATWDGAKSILCLERDKMPFEFLEPQKGFDLSISKYGGSPSKICIKTAWEDSRGVKNSKEQWCDL